MMAAGKQLEKEKSAVSGYFSIDAILARETTVTCRTNSRIPKFGFLAPSSNEVDLEAGTTLELPIWAVNALSRPMDRNQANWVSVVELPYFFEEAEWAVNLDPGANIRVFNDRFFETGVQCSTLGHEDANKLVEKLLGMLTKRIPCIIAKGACEYSEFLEAWESSLLKGWEKTTRNFEDWTNSFVEKTVTVDPKTNTGGESKEEEKAASVGEEIMSQPMSISEMETQSIFQEMAADLPFGEGFFGGEEYDWLTMQEAPTHCHSPPPEVI